MQPVHRVGVWGSEISWGRFLLCSTPILGTFALLATSDIFKGQLPNGLEEKVKTLKGRIIYLTSGIISSLSHLALIALKVKLAAGSLFIVGALWALAGVSAIGLCITLYEYKSTTTVPWGSLFRIFSRRP